MYRLIVIDEKEAKKRTFLITNFKPMIKNVFSLSVCVFFISVLSKQGNSFTV